jgi:Zn-dependent membrane protease YugP/Flp pilus assembly protein TadD
MGFEDFAENCDAGALSSLLICPVVLIALAVRTWIQRWYQRKCSQIGDTPARCGLSGAEATVRMLAASGLGHIPVHHTTNKVNHYHPWRRYIGLNDATYDAVSLYSLAIAAHEVGHAQQFASGLWLCRLRMVFWPICWVLPLVVIALTFTPVFGLPGLEPEYFFPCVVTVFVLSLLLQLPITIPLEHDASRRGKDLLWEAGLIAPREQERVDTALRANTSLYMALEVFRWLVLLVFAVAIGYVYAPMLVEAARTVPASDYVIQQDAMPGNRDVGAQSLAERGLNQPGQFTPEGPAGISIIRDWPSMLFAMAEYTFLVAALLAVLLVWYLCRRKRRSKLTPRMTAIQRNNAGVSLFRQGDIQGAVAEFTEALRFDSTVAGVFVSRGTAYVLLGQFDRALSDYDEAVRLAPDTALTLGGRAAVRLALDDFEGVIADATAALDCDPNRAESFRDRGLAWYFLGEYDRAIADATEAIRLNPADATAVNNRGAALQKIGDYAKALDDFQEAIRLNPKLPHSYKNLAWLRATCPQPEFRNGPASVANVTRAFQLVESLRDRESEREVVEWQAILAAAHAEAGNFEEAIRWQQKCLMESPPEAKEELQNRLKMYEAGEPYREMPAEAHLTGALGSVHEVGARTDDGG